MTSKIKARAFVDTLVELENYQKNDSNEITKMVSDIVKLYIPKIKSRVLS